VKDVRKMIMHARAETSRRFRQLRALLRGGGYREVASRVRRATVRHLAPSSSPLPVRMQDVLAADLTNPKVARSLPLGRDEPLIVNWVTTPPARGSGGHTTMFRLIEGLEQAGHSCRVYIYDVYGSDAAYYREAIKRIFPNFKGTVDDVTAGMADAHAVVATAWPTTYPAFADDCLGRRFYLVQDFEPWFHPVGSHSLLAENSYRMGFHGITAGRFLAEKLAAEYGMTADAFEFGCDTDTYHLLDRGRPRDGIVFYARPDAPRRAFEIGLAALQLFAERRPDIKIHLYGDRIGTLPFRYVDHGLIRPRELNEIYNGCFAGLTLSMTNVSLVPHEMLSAGCIPVVNDAPHNRLVLDNAFVCYAPPTPHALMQSLEKIVDTKDFSALAMAASRSVSSISWDAAGKIVEDSIRRVVRQ
jgi:glycosyltransferase involved in cell wall biosynthesis